MSRVPLLRLSGDDRVSLMTASLLAGGLASAGLACGGFGFTFQKLGATSRPGAEDFLGPRALSHLQMPIDQLLQNDFVFVAQPLDNHEAWVVEFGELFFQIENVGGATSHPGAEIFPGPSQNDDRSSGHVFASMITDSLDDGDSAGIANRKTLSCAAICEEDTAGRAIETGVADN
jgi:hypothetical protein